MRLLLSKKTEQSLLWVPVITFFFIGVMGQIYSPFRSVSQEMLNTGGAASISENILIEHIEAFYWFLGLLFYGLLAYAKRKNGLKNGWTLFFLLLCFFSLGEEVSWGQHFFHYTLPEAVSAVNVQEEFNIHNLNVAKAFGLNEEAFLHQPLRNVTRCLNPAFYLLCISIWLLIPLGVTKFNLEKRMKFLSGFPTPNRGFYWFFSTSIIIYLVTDNLFFDVGELFELTMATAGAVTGLNQLLLFKPEEVHNEQTSRAS